MRICERRTLDGAVAWEEVHASPILDAGGRLTQVVEVWRDISERRAAEAHLAESHRLASIGVARVRIFARTEHAARDGADVRGGHPARHARSRATSATTPRSRASRCCAAAGSRSTSCACRAGSRVSGGDRRGGSDCGRQPPDRAHGPRAFRAASRRGSRREPIHVRADEAEFQNALINLLLNAVQACQPGGRVTVAAARSPADTCASGWRTTAAASPPRTGTHIFEPFFSLRKGGTGLGLFLTLNFVRRCGGDISVESAPGEGAAFEIVLPALVPEAAR